MKLKSLIIGILLFSPLCSAHTIRTATGISVAHQHYYGRCRPPTVCPTADVQFERQNGFSSAARVYSGTAQWNCHGRTFANRTAWVNVADAWVLNDRPYAPYQPQLGDVVVWWDKNDHYRRKSTSHTATVYGYWNGLNTLVSSKYGLQGEYRHALGNTVRVYGPNFSIVRFAAGTLTYFKPQSANASDDAVSSIAETNGDMGESIGEVGASLLEQERSVDWHEKTKANAELAYGAEHPKILKRSTALTAKTKRHLAKASFVEEKIDILIDDFKLPRHYLELSAFNLPAHSEEFITEIVAGKALIELAETEGDRLMIIRKITDMISVEGLDDAVKGAGIYVLGRIVRPDETDFVDSLKNLVNQCCTPQATERSNAFSQYYLDKMQRDWVN